MPNKTLYVRDQDVGLWEQAEQLVEAGESLSSVVAQALERVVSIRSGRRKNNRKVSSYELVVCTPEELDHGEWRKVVIHGSHLVFSFMTGVGGQCQIFQTSKGRLLVHYDFGTRGAHFEVYESISDLRDRWAPYGQTEEWRNNLINSIIEAQRRAAMDAEEIDV